MKTKYLVILSLIFLFSIPSLASANRGMIVVGPREVSLQESGQNAIVAWNGNEEVIILSTDAKSSESTLVLEVLPLPSSPTTVEEGSFDSFTKIKETINKRVRAIRSQGMKGLGMHRSAGAPAPGVEITFHKKIGAHDVTVVKVNDLNYFINWVKNFTISKGFEYSEISLEFKNSVANYLNRDIKFFVFDVIEASENKQSIKPLVYRFNSEFLYYPLEITATSDAGLSQSDVNIFLIAKGIISETAIINTGLWPGTGFDYNIKLSKRELREISPGLEELFESSTFVMNAYYAGPLNRLNKDLIVSQRDIHIPTFSEKISQRVSASSLSLILQAVFLLWEEILSSSYISYGSIWGIVILVIIFSSLIFGILSVVLIIGRLIKKLLSKCNLEAFGYKLFAYAVSIIIVVLLLLSNTVWLASSVIIIFTIIGFSMIIFLVMKFLKKVLT